MKSLLHFEAMEDAAYDLERDNSDSNATLLGRARDTHDAFVNNIVDQSATFLQSLQAPLTLPRADSLPSSPSSASSQLPLTIIIIMRAIPNPSVHLFGTLVFAWRLQVLFAALVAQQEQGNSTMDTSAKLTADIVLFSKAAAHLAMTCEFSDEWLVPLARAMREL